MAAASSAQAAIFKAAAAPARPPAAGRLACSSTKSLPSIFNRIEISEFAGLKSTSGSITYGKHVRENSLSLLDALASQVIAKAGNSVSLKGETVAKLKVAVTGFGCDTGSFLRCSHGCEDSPVHVENASHLLQCDSMLGTLVADVLKASHLLQHDSMLGTFPANVIKKDHVIMNVNGKHSFVFSDKDLHQLLCNMASHLHDSMLDTIAADVIKVDKVTVSAADVKEVDTVTVSVDGKHIFVFCNKDLDQLLWNKVSHVIQDDSILGTFAADVIKADHVTMSVDGKHIFVFSNKDLHQLLSNKTLVGNNKVKKCIQAGGKKVIIVAPEKGTEEFSNISSNAGGPTNSLPPLANSSGESVKEESAVANIQIDWKETPKEHIFMVDVPGLKKEEVKVELEEDQRILRISGERSKEEEQTCEKWHYNERSSGKFLRCFRLPENTKIEDIKACMHNGILSVKLLKRPVKSIEICG